MATKKKTAAAETSKAAEITEAAKEQTAPAATKKERIYAGATLPGFPSGTVFTGDLPDRYAQSDVINSLCIPVEKYADFVIKKSVTTSPAAILYRKSAEYAAKIRAKK